MDAYKNLPIAAFASVAEWEAWLSANQDAPGIWMQYAKKGSGTATITCEESRDLAIAYGWIDGLLNTYDQTNYLRRFTPRARKSGWSKVNCAVAEKLVAEGQMQPAGLAQGEAAKADGRWERAYDSQSTLQVPNDFQAALDAVPNAAAFFAILGATARYPFLYSLQTLFCL